MRAVFGEMGGCASASVRDSSSDSKIMIKLRLFFSPHKAAHKANPTLYGDRSISFRSQSALHSPGRGGSEVDTFFDSKAWLDSDCEDDFFSVKGDFTPSRGSTPVHHSFSIGTPQVNKSLFIESTPEPSPKKKRLSELFQESSREDGGVDFEDQNNENWVNTDVKSKTTKPGFPPRPINGANNGYYGAQKEKTVKSAQGCLPKMLLSRSFNERSKMSPAQSFG